MKTIHVFTSLVFIFSGLLISCSKEEQGKDNSLIPANDLKLARMIQNFKARGESHLKSGEEMSVDSALWYLSSTVNFTYGDGSRDFTEFWKDTSYLSLPVNNGKISESEIYNKYIEIVDNLRSQYQASSKENKQLISATICALELAPTQLQCQVIATFAYGNPYYGLFDFNDIDYWGYWWLDVPGICEGPNSNTNLTSDAAEQSQKKILLAKGALPVGAWIEELPNNEGYKPINNPLDYPINTGVPYSNNRYSHLYWQSTQYTNPGPVTCIPPADLNFYLIKTKELVFSDTDHYGIRPVGTSFVDIDMWGYKDILSSYPFVLYMHRALVHYGIVHFSGGTPESLD